MLPRHNRLFFRKLTFSFPRRSLSPFILILVLDLIRAPKLMCPTLDRPLSTPTFIGILSHLVSSQLQVFYNYFHRYISSLGQTTLKNYYSWFQIILSFSNSLYSLLRVMIYHCTPVFLLSWALIGIPNKNSLLNMRAIS